MNESIKIQNMILSWLAAQRNPVSHEKIRDICSCCVLSVTGAKDMHCLYRYFYPMVRAGFIECGIENRTTTWQLAKPMVFYQDNNSERFWIGINLTETQKDMIAFDLQEDDNNSDFEQHYNVVRWTSPLEYTCTELPIISNAPVISLLKSFPSCKPEVFAKEEYYDISKFKQIYSPYGGWECVSHDRELHPGFYRLSDTPYSIRVYWHQWKTYLLGDVVNDSFWAKIQHCIDSNKSIAQYDEKNQTLHFYLEPPFILARILFLNQMFEKFRVNTQTYYNVTRSQLKELQRIFCSQIIRGDNDND